MIFLFSDWTDSCKSSRIMGKHGLMWRITCILNLIFLLVKFGEGVDILIFADGVSIHRSLIDGSQHHILPLNHIQKAKFVEFDPQSKQIYWSDVQTKQIWRTDLCGEEQQHVFTVNASSYTYFISLALDYEARKIYWTNTGYDIIERLNFDGSGHVEITTERIGSPKDLEIDINKGFLYWLDGGTRPKIERSKLDGSGRVMIFDLKDQYPSALALDVDGQKLFWNDGNDQSVWVGDSDGSRKRQLASKSVHSFPNMIGISVLDGYLYWESLVNKRIERMAKSGSPSKVEIVVTGVEDVVEVKAVKVALSDIQCAPGAPTNVRVNNVGNTSVTVTWKAGYNWGTSQSFRIDLNTSVGWRAVVPSVPSSDQREYSSKVTDLDPNSDYRIRIKACNSVKGCNKDKFDEILSFKTKGYPEVLLSPTLHKVSNITATLRYTLINIKQAELTSLVVLGRIQNSDWSLFVNFSSSMTDSGDVFVTVSNLKPRQKYDFLVRPCNEYGCNPKDPELLSITTLGYPDLPRGIHVLKVSNSSAEVEFSSESVNTQQEVIINILNSADLSPLEVLHTVSSTEGTQRAEIKSLQPKTEYSVTLKVCNVFGCNPQQTTPLTFVTEGVPDNPDMFKVTNKTSDSVTLTWRVTSDHVGLLQQLHLAENNGNWSLLYRNRAVEGLQDFIYRGLKQERTYSFRLSVCNVYGCNSESVLLLSDHDVDKGEDDNEEGFLTSRQRMVIIIVAVVVGVFIIIVILVFVAKCVVRNKRSKDDYMHVRGTKPANI